jgi:hypothetical protein
MTMEPTKKWFDEKYSGVQKSTLEDRSELFKGILISSDRCRREVSEALGEVLFRLNQGGGYSPLSTHGGL